MYKINVNNDIPREPWLIPTATRSRMVKDALRQGKKVALLIYEQPDTSTFRYRAYNVMQASYDSTLWQAVYFYMTETAWILDLLDSVHEAVFIRVRWTNPVDLIVARARERGIPVLFDVDDLIYDLNYLNMVTNTLNVQFENERDCEFWFACVSRIGFTASKADGFITTNDFLGRRISEKFGKPYGLIPNSINKEQLEISGLCAEKKRARKSSRPFTVGYFSGTPSHINDFRTVSPELTAFLRDFPGTRLSVVGFMEFPEDMKPLIRAGRVTFTPLVDFIELQRLVAQVDVNIVPLVNNTFTNCKSELKFFEAAIVDTVTVATPTYTYKSCITHGENGFLCNPGQWYDVLMALYTGAADTEKIISSARGYALDHYCGRHFTEQIERCYSGFLR